MHLSYTKTAQTQFTLPSRGEESETNFLKPADKRVRNHMLTEMLEISTESRTSFSERARYRTLPQNHTLVWELLHTLYHILSNSSTWLLFKAGAILPSESEQDEGHGSTGAGEEDGLEDCVPPYIPALAFIVVRRCSYHRPTALYSQWLLRGGISGSSQTSKLHPDSKAPGERSISGFARGLTE